PKDAEYICRNCKAEARRVATAARTYQCRFCNQPSPKPWHPQCFGQLSKAAKELGVSYPTVRLHVRRLQRVAVESFGQSITDKEALALVRVELSKEPT